MLCGGKTSTNKCNQESSSQNAADLLPAIKKYDSCTRLGAAPSYNWWFSSSDRWAKWNVILHLSQPGDVMWALCWKLFDLIPSRDEGMLSLVLEQFHLLRFETFFLFLTVAYSNYSEQMLAGKRMGLCRKYMHTQNHSVMSAADV